MSLSCSLASSEAEQAISTFSAEQIERAYDSVLPFKGKGGETIDASFDAF